MQNHQYQERIDKLEKDLVKCKVGLNTVAQSVHEIRTPLGAVLGCTVILEKMALSGEQRQQVEMIRRWGEDLLHILNNVFDTVKIILEQVEPEKEKLG